MTDYCTLLHTVLSQCHSELSRREAAETALCLAAGFESEAEAVREHYEMQRLQETAVLRGMIRDELQSYADAIDQGDDLARADLLAAAKSRIDRESIRLVREQVAAR